MYTPKYMIFPANRAEAATILKLANQHSGVKQRFHPNPSTSPRRINSHRRSWDVSESAGAQWAEDYSEEQPYRSATASTTGFVPGPPPQMYYLDGNSHVSLLRWAFLPTWAPFELGSVEAELRPLVTEEEALMLVEAGVNTIAELVSANKYTVLKLRGYDIPQVRGGGW